MIEFNKAAVYLALDSKFTVKRDENLLIEEKLINPQKEAEEGEQLQRELDDYKKQRLEIRNRVFQAMFKAKTGPIEDQSR